MKTSLVSNKLNTHFFITTTKMKLLTLLMVFLSSWGWGQTTLLSPTGDGGFENGSTFAANGWTVENYTSSNTNKWFVGSAATASAGTNSAYISDNATGSTYNYINSSASRVMFWRDVTFPAGETKVTLTFKIKCQGESTYDDLSIFIQNSSTPPSTSTQPSSTTTAAPSITNTTNLGTYSILPSYTTQTISISSALVGNSSGPTTRRLIFYWENDVSGGVQPPVSIDEISLTSAVPNSYTWNATTGSAAWATASNWTPSRITPDASDILNFSNGGSSIVTSIPTQTVGNIVFSNSTQANFQAASTATLTAGGLTIPSGSTLMSNGTTAALTIAFSSGAVNTIGGRLEISNTGTPANGITFANSVTTVSSTGNLAAGGSVAATVTGTTTTLVINGTYEHKYTTVGGTIPSSTWGANSNCNITSYTTNTNPSGIGQNFANVSWNCPSQTGNMNLTSSSTTGISGTFNFITSGTGTVRWTGTGSYTLNVTNFSQSGGIFDIASGASGSGMSMNVSGTFNQSAGTFLSSGTVTNNPTLHFNGTTNQNVTFTTQPTGPITYRISNPNGITLTGPSATFSIGNGTLGGLRISTTGTSPITFGGSTTTLQYNTANSTLTYDATTGNTTVRDVEFPATNGPANLTVAVGSANILTVPFSRTIPGTLTMTSGNIDISSNNLTLGTSTSALGTLTYTAGAIRVTSGTLTRWFGTTGLPTTAPTSGIGFYPLATGLNNRNVGVYFSTGTALTSGGTITIGHTDVAGLSTITSFLDGAYNVDTRTNASWSVSTGNGIAATGTIGMRLTGAGAFSTSTVANLRLIQATASIGVHVAGTGTSPNFQANRTGLSLTDIANTHYIGSGSADIQSVFNSVASGDWNNVATWDIGSVPTCTGNVTIMNGHNVTVNSVSNVSRNLTVNTGGTLTVASGDLTVGCTLNNTPFTNNGTLTVSGGTLNVNGNIVSNLGSTFNQSGGNINIDGNAAGNATNSVASATALLQFNQLNSGINLTGGTLTIVDPHANSTSSNSIAVINATTGTQTSTVNHTLRLGDGISTDAGGNIVGFRIDPWNSNAFLSFGNIIVNGSTGTNRLVTSAYQLAAIGDVTVTSGSTLNLTSTLIVAGNLNVNSGGTLVNTAGIAAALVASNTNSSLVFGPSTNAQTIGGSGTYQNTATAPTANLTAFSINNSNSTGVTLNIPLSISGTLTMTAGKINTTATNLLTLGTTSAAGTLSYTGGQITGPFARTFAASRTASGTYDATTLFPVGKGTAYTPIWIDPTTTSGGAVIMTGEAFSSNSGSAASGVSNLSTNTWTALPTTGSANFTSARIRLTDASVTTSSSLLQASLASGAYNGIDGGSTSSGAAGNVTSLAAVVPFSGYFAYGNQTYTWTGATSTAWNTTTNWSPAAVPTSNDNVIIPTSGITNFPVVSGLTIAAGSTMTLNANTRLTVNGNIVNNGTLTLESGATLVQGTGNTASGTGVYNVQQALTGAGGATPNGRFWYMGSPLSGASSTAFDAAGANKLWTYAEATQSYSEITTNGVTMSPIQGHVARLGASSTINFTGGVLNSGDYTNNTLTNTGTGSTRGYTLVSNPYPSFLDWDLIAAGATGITSSLWYRTNSGSSMVYDTYNATGGVSALNSGVTTNPRFIPPMQAFWVYNQTDGTTGSLTISNNMRSHQSNGGLKDATDFPAFVRLNLENDGAIDQTVLYFDNNAAAGYDNFDSDKMMVSNAAQVYTLVGNKKLAINGMKSVKANKQVPLTVEFPTAKAYAFNATEVAMIGGIVLLEDRLKKVFQDLTMNPVYEFVADAGTTSDRFVVHFQPNGGVAGIESAADNGIAIVSNTAGLVTITLSEELPAMGTIQIIDINGKVIATQAINEQTTTMNINASTGVYHVLVDSASKVARKKIVITK